MRSDNIDDYYPLAPAQQGMLFHALHDPASSAYVGQLAFTFFERFDRGAFEDAWRILMRRHAALRSFFVWDNLRDPAQVVRSQVDLPIEHHDWRHLSHEAVESEQRDLLARDRRRGFDLSRAPAMRLLLIALPGDRCRFIWSHHHILLDGWSVPLLLDELLTLYSSGSGVSEPDLPVRRPYRDYIAWLAKQDVRSAETYWRAALKGMPSPLLLGDSVARDRDVDPERWQEELAVDAELLGTLRDTGRACRVTLNTIVQTAWALLLGRYADRTDTVHGVTVSGRPPDLEGAEQMIGLFINTLPLRVRWADADSIADLLRRVQNHLAEARQFEYSRLVDVQGWSDVPRGAALFDTIVVFENYPRSRAGGPAAAVAAGDLTFHQKTNYALTLAIATNSSGLVLRAIHDPARIDSAAASRVLGHLRQILASIAARPEQRVGALEMLTPGERAGVVDETAPSPAQETILQRFDACVRSRPDALAVVSETSRLTYAELDEGSTRLAGFLRERGVGTEQVVAIGCDRGVEGIVATLAVLKAGAAYLPIDPAHPRARVEFLLSDSRAVCLLTTSAAVDALEDIACPTIVLDGKDRDAIARCLLDPSPIVAVSPLQLAYVIYTSGSTAQPKGVMVRHRSVVNLVDGQARALAIDARSRELQFAAPTFDASVAEIFTALLTGATLHVASTDALRPGDGLLQLLRDREISVVTLPPSLLAVMPETDLPHLRTLVSAGEALPEATVRRWSGGRRFLNAYGPTETTVCATVSAPLVPGAPVDIGEPLPNARVYLLDGGLRPVPTGVPGEIYVGGEPLARGYINRPDLTAAGFLPDPFSAAPGARMYRTGDRARRMADGRLLYLGRRDFQVKLRGFRIELEEIEARLLRQPGVAGACAVVREDRPGDRRLVAYVVSRDARRPEPRDLAAALRAELPDYMIPSPIVVLEEFPLTSSGKVDRRTLPLPEVQGALREGAVAPRNEPERTIAAIWCDVLQVSAVGVHDNFFDLGGHSLLMLQVHGKLKRAFSKDISLIQMFGHPTIESLATYFTRSDDPQPRALESIQQRVRRKREAQLAAVREAGQ